MFDIGFLELLLVSVVGLLVLGPERLPGAIRTVSLWLGKLRSGFNSVRSEIERELRADEIRQDLHNQSVMDELRRAELQLRSGLDVDGNEPPHTGPVPEPSAGAEQEPSATTEQEPSATTEQEPSAAEEQAPSAAKEQKPSATAEQKPEADQAAAAEREPPADHNEANKHE
ncbi:MAG: Sec-independent protein translocase protein TatB [Halieaceae bacterium]